MKDLIERMNSILSDWKTMFDVTSKMQLEFSLTDEGHLSLNEHEIHMPVDLVLDSVDFNAENIKFWFDGTHKVLVIGIKWPEDDVPEVNTIQFGYEGV